jgi:hypothetical protein
MRKIVKNDAESLEGKRKKIKKNHLTFPMLKTVNNGQREQQRVLVETV